MQKRDEKKLRRRGKTPASYFLKIHGKMDYLSVILTLRSILFSNYDNCIVIFIRRI